MDFRKNDYKSSILRCHVDDPDCVVCRFLSGSRNEDDLLGVIDRLDRALARSEEIAATLIKSMNRLTDENLQLKVNGLRATL